MFTVSFLADRLDLLGCAAALVVACLGVDAQATEATAVHGLIAVWAYEAAVKLLRSYRGWRSITERQSFLEDVRARRDATVAVVNQAAAPDLR